MIKSYPVYEYKELQGNIHKIQKCFSNKVEHILQNIESFLFWEENNKGLIYLKEKIKNIIYNFYLYKEKKLGEELDRIIWDALIKFAYYKTINDDNYSPEKASKEYIGNVDKKYVYPFLTKFFQEWNIWDYDNKIIKALRGFLKERIENYASIYNKVGVINIKNNDGDLINKIINKICSEFFVKGGNTEILNEFIKYFKIFLENIFEPSLIISTTDQ